jgi:hypothetical protein
MTTRGGGGLGGVAVIGGGGFGGVDTTGGGGGGVDTNGGGGGGGVTLTGGGGGGVGKNGCVPWLAPGSKGGIATTGGGTSVVGKGETGCCPPEPLFPPIRPIDWAIWKICCTNCNAIAKSEGVP